jgi:hypothetical protein
MLNTLLDGIAHIIPFFNDPAYQHGLTAAAQLSGPQRCLTYGKLDLDLARNAAPLAEFGNSPSYDFFSERIGFQRPRLFSRGRMQAPPAFLREPRPSPSPWTCAGGSVHTVSQSRPHATMIVATRRPHAVSARVMRAGPLAASLPAAVRKWLHGYWSRAGMV